MNNFTNTIKNHKVLGFVIILYFLLQIPFLDSLPKGKHLWRQVDTLAVAKNFYEENMNLFKPRIDNRGEGNGETGMHFPLYEYGLAALYKTFGFNPFLHRYYSVFISLLTIICFYFFFMFLLKGKPKSKFLTEIATIFFSFSPFWIYYGNAALPDILAMFFCLSGLLFFLRWQQKKKVFLSISLITFAALIKIQYLLIGLPMAVIFFDSIYHKKFSLKKIIFLCLSAGICLTIVFIWYRYAFFLQKESGLNHFGITVNLVTDFQQIKKILGTNFSPTFLLSVVNPISFLFLITGSVVFFKKKNKTSSLFFIVLFWSIGLVVYHFVALERMAHHDYYMFVHVPILILIITFGFYRFYCWMTKKNYNTKKIVLSLSPIVLYIVLSFIIAFNNRNDKYLFFKEFYNFSQRTALIKATSKTKNIFVGSDDSKCIMLYFLEKKGWTFNGLLNEQKLKTYLDRGAEFLYVQEKDIENREKLLKYFSTPKKIGNFLAIELKRE